MKKVNVNKGKIGYKFSVLSKLFQGIFDEENLNMHVPLLERGPSMLL